MADEQTMTRCDRLRRCAPKILGVLVQQDMVWAADEIARLTAEVERMRPVVDAARELANYWTTSDEALKAKLVLLDALRAMDGEP